MRMFPAGAEDYIKSADRDLWLQAMLDKAQPSPPFYSPEFEEWANAVLEDMDLDHKNITPQNCRAVYLKLLQYAFHSNLPA